MPPGAYIICIYEIPVWRGTLTARQRLPNVPPTKESSSQSLALTTAQGGKEAQRTPTPEQGLAQTLLQVLRQHTDEFVGIQETQLLLRRLAEEHPDLERELQRNVPLAALTDVLKRLVREDISIRNLREIAHGLIEWAPREKDTVLVTEYVRTCLSRYISIGLPIPDGSLSAIVLHPTVEEQMRQAIRQTSAGAVLMLNPATAQQIAGQIRVALQPYMGSGERSAPVVLLDVAGVAALSAQAH